MAGEQIPTHVVARGEDAPIDRESRVGVESEAGEIGDLRAKFSNLNDREVVEGQHCHFCERFAERRGKPSPSSAIFTALSIVGKCGSFTERRAADIAPLHGSDTLAPWGTTDDLRRRLAKNIAICIDTEGKNIYNICVSS